MNLYEYYDKRVRIVDNDGDIVEGYVFDYDDGDEEDEDSKYYNVPNITLEHTKVIKSDFFHTGKMILFYETDIKSIEIIK